MSARTSSGAAAGVLLVLAGLWLLLQTLMAGLPQRLVKGLGSSSSPATPSTSPDSPQGNISTQPAPNPGSTAAPGTQPSPGYQPYVPPVGGPLPGTPGPGSTAANPNNPTSPPAPY